MCVGMRPGVDDAGEEEKEKEEKEEEDEYV